MFPERISIILPENIINWNSNPLTYKTNFYIQIYISTVEEFNADTLYSIPI